MMGTGKLRYVSDEEQIAAIDNAIKAGWTVRAVHFGPHADCIVTFVKTVQNPDDSPLNPPGDPYKYIFPGLTTATHDWGCGFAAGQYAEEIMKKSAAGWR